MHKIAVFLIILLPLITSCTQQNHNKTTSSTTNQVTEQNSNQSSTPEQEIALAYLHAARIGDTKLMQMFIDSGANLNYQNNQGYSGLMVAAFRGQTQIIDQLLAAGASACLVDERGNTALMAALVSGELSISRKLFAIDCDNEHLDNRSLEFATRFGQQEIATLLKHRQTKQKANQ